MFSWLFSDPLPVGVEAPDFSLPDQDGNIVSLAELRGKNVVLVFYPGDETSICRRQLCAFRDKWGDAQARDTLIFGVNPQSAAKHADFRNRQKFPFPLLVDKGQKTGANYHTNGLIVKRTVYLIGKSGRIRFGKRGTPEAGEVLAAAE